MVFSKEKNGLGWRGKGDADPSTEGRCSGSGKVIHGDRGEDPGEPRVVWVTSLAIPLSQP